MNTSKNTDKKVVPTAFYLVSKALGRAMKEGREYDKGTIYGVFATEGRANASAHARGLTLCSVVVHI